MHVSAGKPQRQKYSLVVFSKCQYSEPRWMRYELCNLLILYIVMRLPFLYNLIPNLKLRTSAFTFDGEQL